MVIVFIIMPILRMVSNMKFLNIFCVAIVFLTLILQECLATNTKNVFSVLKEGTGIELERLKDFPTQLQWDDLKDEKRILLKSQNDQASIHLEILTPENPDQTFKDFVKINFSLIKNLYGQSTSQYPGIISKKQGCSSAGSLPQIYEIQKNNVTYHILEGATNERFAFGVCNGKDRRYQGGIIIFRNKGSITTLKVFSRYQTFQKDKNFLKK